MGQQHHAHYVYSEKEIEAILTDPNTPKSVLLELVAEAASWFYIDIIQHPNSDLEVLQKIESLCDEMESISIIEIIDHRDSDAELLDSIYLRFPWARTHVLKSNKCSIKTLSRMIVSDDPRIQREIANVLNKDGVLQQYLTYELEKKGYEIPEGLPLEWLIETAKIEAVPPYDN